MNDDIDKQFGSRCGGSRWFNQDPQTREQPMRAVRVTWPCPVHPCEGEMVYNGMSWPTGDPGYHHTCTICKFTAAIHGHRYPAIEYRPVDA